MSGVAIGGSSGSLGVDYRFSRGRHDHAHSVGLSFMALIPAW